jgi:hypothetical protein
MWGVAEGVCELVGPFDVADVVLEVMYHGMVFMIFLGGKIIKKIFLLMLSFFFFCSGKRKMKISLV